MQKIYIYIYTLQNSYNFHDIHFLFHNFKNRLSKSINFKNCLFQVAFFNYDLQLKIEKGLNKVKFYTKIHLINVLKPWGNKDRSGGMKGLRICIARCTNIKVSIIYQIYMLQYKVYIVILVHTINNYKSQVYKQD